MATPSPHSPSADDADTGGYDRPSKTQLKKDMHELQALGEALVALPDNRVVDLPIAERLRDAVAEYKRTRSFEGKRRQMQYIGKLMRGCDSEPIKEAVASFQLGHARNALALHDSERWRAELVADDNALTRWVAEYPQSDVQKLRALIRNARKDFAAAPENRSGRGFRELFQYIRQTLEGQGRADEGDELLDEGEGED